MHRLSHECEVRGRSSELVKFAQVNTASSGERQTPNGWNRALWCLPCVRFLHRLRWRRCAISSCMLVPQEKRGDCGAARADLHFRRRIRRRQSKSAALPPAGRYEHFREVVRPHDVTGRLEFEDIPPSVVLYHLDLLSRPVVPQDCLMVFHGDNKEPFISHDLFAVRQPQDELSLRNWGTYVGDKDSRFFFQLSHCRVGEGFTGLQPATRSRPVVLSLQRPALMHKAKEQETSRAVENEQSG